MFFNMQVVMNKCFVLNLVKTLAQSRLVDFNSKKMISPSQRLGLYSKNQLSG